MKAYLNALGVICALGSGKRAVLDNLLNGSSPGMRSESGWLPERAVPVGAVDAELPAMPSGFAERNTRNNRLLLAAALEIEGDIRQAIERFGASRIGVVLGTSTTGIHEASQGIAALLHEGAFPPDYSYRHQELAAPAAFLADWLQLSGPAYSISTACTSSGRALLSARRLLDLGVCDAVLCGGVDSLCGLTLNGFDSLEALSDAVCNPFSRQRKGINIGEGAALFLMTREPPADLPIALLGAGASSDAHHISAPEPTGRGALLAMRKALKSAALEAGQIDYLNLHGTATTHNDAMESLAVAELFPAGVPCSSSKPLSGHTLGAAGALEAAFCWLCLGPDNRDNLLPPQVWDGLADPALPRLDLVAPGRVASRPLRHMMSNSFAFGGNNVSLILGRVEPEDRA